MDPEWLASAREAVAALQTIQGTSWVEVAHLIVSGVGLRVSFGACSRCSRLVGGGIERLISLPRRWPSCYGAPSNMRTSVLMASTVGQCGVYCLNHKRK